MAGVAPPAPHHGLSLGPSEPRSHRDSLQESIPAASINQYNKQSHEQALPPAQLPLSPRQHCRYIFLSWNL